MAQLKDKKIIITGGAGGIGCCTAQEFAKAGSELILTDINKKKLDQVAKNLRRQYRVKVYTRLVDTTQQKDVASFAEWVLKTVGPVDVLINNAGVGYSGELVETTFEDWRKLFDVNFWGPLYHIYSFLPSMIKAGHGHIVNVSSGQAFFRLPTWGAYATVKLALGAFSEILRYEVKKFNLHVTTFYPFMVNTGFYKDIEGENFFQKMSMKLVPYYSMSPEKVAKILFKAVQKKKGVEMVSLLNDFAKLTRFIPAMSDIVGQTTIAFMGKSPEELRQLIMRNHQAS